MKPLDPSSSEAASSRPAPPTESEPSEAAEPAIPAKSGSNDSESVEKPNAHSAKRRFYSRRGDLGETSLFSGPRVGKDQKRIVAVGVLDELNSFLGLARSFLPPPEVDREIEAVQKKLFDIGTEMVAMTPAKHGVKTIQKGDIDFLETKIDYWNDRLPPLNHFLIPGGSSCAATLHVARAVCRRAERRTVALVRSDETVSRRLIAWLNRLGDLLFVLARAAQTPPQ